MPEGPTQLVARHIRDLVDRQRLDALGDRELLERYCQSRDEDAFAALVRRHGPVVLGTCRRILRHAHDAEDACQATFVILARKGRSVRGSNCLAGWLHRVAVRVALRLRKDVARRAFDELPAELSSCESAGDALIHQEVRATFDAEVVRLPRRFRLPLVLCYLQGLTRNEAAIRLGWTEGALRGRLERGRKLLQARFTRKGLTLSTALAPMLLETEAPAIAPSTTASRLADAVLRSAATARIKLAAWTTAAILLVGTVASLGLFQPVAGQPKPTRAPPPAASSSSPTISIADAEKNLETLVLRLSLAPQGEGKFDPRFTLYHVLLYVPNLPLEPPANGPSGKPIEAHARITREQAKKIVEALGRFDFFREDAVFNDPFNAKLQITDARDWPHVAIAVRFQNGEDASRKERLLAWLPTMLPPLDAIRGCVDGDAAKALDRLLAQLADDRKKWDSTIDADLRKMQGSWVIDPRDINLDGLPSPYMCKCTIDGDKITFKPKVQIDPLLDLDTIKGSFELKQEGDLRTLKITGTRDTVTKIESGTWKLIYRVTDSTLTLLLPASGKALPADGKPRPEQGDREFVFKRIAAAISSDWGESSIGIRSRIRMAKQKYALTESPTFDLDLRETTPGIAEEPWHWQGLRVGQLAEVEVDGVWYRGPETNFTSAVMGKLSLGQSIDGWASVRLVNDYWIAKDSGEKKLKLTPGKHRVRVRFRLRPTDSGDRAADPVSGSLEIEMMPMQTKAAPTVK